MLPVVAGTAFRRVDTVFEVDWTSTTPGVGSMAGTGTLYERLSAQFSVQTGPDTVSTDALLANSSSVPIGKNLGSAGLVIDEGRQGFVEDWRNVTGTHSNWFNPGGGTATANAAVSPDGTMSAGRLQTTSGSSGYYCATSYGGTSVNHIWTFWHKAGSVAATGQRTIDIGLVTDIFGSAGTEPTTWTKTSIFVPANSNVGALLRVAEGRDRTSIGGIAAGARDVLVDFVSAEPGNFPTESLGGGFPVTRGPPKWYRNVGSTCLAADGSLRLYIECEPKGASGEYTSDMTLWYIDTNNNCVVDFATQAIKITIGGSTYTTPVSMSWSREDRLRIFVAVGGNALTEVQYAVNASSPVRISTGTPPTFGSISIPGNLDYLQTNKTKTFSVRCQKVRFYKVGKKPIDFP